MIEQDDIFDEVKDNLGLWCAADCSGADLENLLNEAALHAVRTGHKMVAPDDIEEARDKLIMGPRKIRKMRPEDIKLTAYHEAGHAYVSTVYADVTDPIHKATIIPRGRATGIGNGATFAD